MDSKTTFSNTLNAGKCAQDVGKNALVLNAKTSGAQVIAVRVAVGRGLK